ncbi:MAG: MFS transporter [Chitinophagaceae bacterium]|nr:MAG: MFS transporter [Chitinophagaceae bacterium]
MLKPSAVPLTEEQVRKGLRLVVLDGLADEALVVLTSGTFLVALALSLGASNVQIGLLAGLPVFMNLFQLIAIWLVQKYRNRKLITTIGNFMARFPILAVGTIPFLFSTGTSIGTLIMLLALHYFFGSIAGASWNSWMKDLIPQQQLGSFFSNRLRRVQTLNVIASILLALILDWVTKHHPDMETTAYAIMFLTGGAIGIWGSWLLSRTPEPPSEFSNENLFKLLGRPLKDANFRRLLFFNAFWAFALNLATPFFTVFMLKSIGLPLITVIAVGIAGQLASIFSLRLWGRFADQYSNKTIIRVAAPTYIVCILGWSFVTIPETDAVQIGLIALISILSGAATAGINMAMTNIGLKLAPRDSSIAYISVKNMTVAFISAAAPIVGGSLADYFSDRFLAVNVDWIGPNSHLTLHLMDLNNWNFLFVIGGLLAIVALQTLKVVKEEGEVERSQAIREMRTVVRGEVRQLATKESLIDFVSLPVTIPIRITKKIIETQQALQARLFAGFNQQNGLADVDTPLGSDVIPEKPVTTTSTEVHQANGV